MKTQVITCLDEEGLPLIGENTLEVYEGEFVITLSPSMNQVLREGELRSARIATGSTTELAIGVGQAFCFFEAMAITKPDWFNKCRDGSCSDFNPLLVCYNKALAALKVHQKQRQEEIENKKRQLRQKKASE